MYQHWSYIYSITRNKHLFIGHWKEKVVEMTKQKGVFDHGRIGHEQLKEEFLKSGIWAYPTDFTEISCINAMKAQAYGAIPVVTNFAALKETVKNGIKVDVDIQTQEGQKTYINELVKLLNDPKKQEEMREPMMKYARENFGWDKVAKKWNDLFQTEVME